MSRTVRAMNECPYSDKPCPKMQNHDERLDKLETNQLKLMRLLYYIAGIVSVSLGVQVVI